MEYKNPHENTQSSMSERLGKVFKVVIIEEETLSTIANYRASYGKYLAYFFGLLLIVVAITSIIISTTSIKRLIPGYGEIEENRKYLQLKDRIKELEEGVETQKTYINGLRKMLSGNIESDSIKVVPSSHLPSASNKPIIVTEAERKETNHGLNLNKQLLSSPVIGSISSAFDATTGHYGIDVLAPKGTPIKAIAAGIIIYSDWSIDGGNVVAIQHNHNVVSIYKHNSSLLKNVGEIVRMGEAIAIIGNSGTLSSGPHLHFELWYNGNPVNPTNYLTF